MKTRCILTTAGLVLATLIYQPSTGFAQGTAFTYQGRLTDNGSPADGIYDLRFAIYDASSGGTQQAVALTNAATAVSNGLFTVTLDFGNQFPGADRWLEIGVLTNGGGAFSTLAPRQLLTSTPYAVRAANFSGTIAATQLSGTYTGAVAFNNLANSFTGNGGSLTDLSATALSSGIVPSAALANAWRIAGNAGTTNSTHFVGTTDNQALDFRVFNQRGLRLQPNTNGTPTIIGGSLFNVVSAHTPGATIAGGDRNTIFSSPGLPVEFTSQYAVIGGGSSNYIDMTSANSVIGGGFQNSLEPNTYFSTIAGGLQNRGGTLARHSSISGGRNNTLDQLLDAATIGGGANNFIGGYSDFAGIGSGEKNYIGTNAQYSAISGGWENTNGPGTFYSHIGGGQRNRITAGFNGTISGGGANSIEGDSGAIGGGKSNGIRTGAYDSTIGGGNGNTIQTDANTSVIAGGGGNEIQNDASTSFIGGGSNNRISANAGGSVISGGGINIIQRDADHAAIGGGQLNTISPGAEQSVIGGGDGNTVGAIAGTVGGGALNVIETNAVQAVIAGGGGNRMAVGATNSTIGGGFGNAIGDGSLSVNGLAASTIAGGQRNSISNEGATIGGGGQNTNSGYYATIPGGTLNMASGQFSFAAGLQAQALHDGSFVWSDIPGGQYSSTLINQFSVRAANGVRISNQGDGRTLLTLETERSWAFRQLNTGANTALELGTVDAANRKPFIIQANAVGIGTVAPSHLLHVNGVARSTQSTWATSSDKRAKRDIENLEGSLERIAQLRPVSFEYTDEYAGGRKGYEGRFTGFVAQEVESVFPEMVETVREKIGNREVGDFRVLNTGGLTPHLVAAIQGLNQKVEEQKEELKQKETEITELKQRLEKLERGFNEVSRGPK